MKLPRLYKGYKIDGFIPLYGVFLNSGMYGQPEGCTMGLPIRHERRQIFPLLSWPTTTVAIYPFRVNHINPLTFVVGPECARVLNLPTIIPEGTEARVDDMDTDQTSIPATLQVLYPKDRYLGAYIHDYGYDKEGLWLRRPGESDFTFVPLRRSTLDKLLMETVGAEGGNAFDRGMFFQAVHFGGAGVWNRHPTRQFGAWE